MLPNHDWLPLFSSFLPPTAGWEKETVFKKKKTRKGSTSSFVLFASDFSASAGHIFRLQHGGHFLHCKTKKLAF